MATIILSPGYTNAGPEHWMTFIERKYQNIVRVEQKDWECPKREEWIAGLEHCISSIEGDIVLVGHSCGANVIAQWAEKHDSSRVKAALLVAPADIDAEKAISEIQVQRPMATQKLPFKSLIVCSDNDEHMSLSRSKETAEQWGSDIVVKKGASHFHTDAGYGDWPEGEAMIESLIGEQLLFPILDGQ
ncbi:RBBP9/YdeN family alpha/beta hydrolase [Vibrio sonorensis]|uniref:RBBP9/YdeN family alpha/beta hydrolase n=1 Tax=Vibrio sonorensis TaxID=1004316 RepID=UPI0009FBD47D|nr:alpha/beta hydrolase [Vibrio sonorensis]